MHGLPSAGGATRSLHSSPSFKLWFYSSCVSYWLSLVYCQVTEHRTPAGDTDCRQLPPTRLQTLCLSTSWGDHATTRHPGCPAVRAQGDSECEDLLNMLRVTPPQGHNSTQHSQRCYSHIPQMNGAAGAGQRQYC